MSMGPELVTGSGVVFLVCTDNYVVARPSCIRLLLLFMMEVLSSGPMVVGPWSESVGPSVLSMVTSIVVMVVVTAIAGISFFFWHFLVAKFAF